MTETCLLNEETCLLNEETHLLNEETCLLNEETCLLHEETWLLNEETCLLEEVNIINTACRANRHAVSYLLKLRDTGTCTVMHAFHIAISRELRDL